MAKLLIILIVMNGFRPIVHYYMITGPTFHSAQLLMTHTLVQMVVMTFISLAIWTKLGTKAAKHSSELGLQLILNADEPIPEQTKRLKFTFKSNACIGYNTKGKKSLPPDLQDLASVTCRCWFGVFYGGHTS